MKTHISTSKSRYVEQFGASNAYFIQEFSKVYSKVLTKGYTNLRKVARNPWSGHTGHHQHKPHRKPHGNGKPHRKPHHKRHL